MTGQQVTKEKSLQRLVDAYWAIVMDVCAHDPACRTDGGAMQHMDLAWGHLSADLNHLSVAGHAKKAAIEWAALTAALTARPALTAGS